VTQKLLRRLTLRSSFHTHARLAVAPGLPLRNTNQVTFTPAAGWSVAGGGCASRQPEKHLEAGWLVDVAHHNNVGSQQSKCCCFGNNLYATCSDCNVQRQRSDLTAIASNPTKLVQWGYSIINCYVSQLFGGASDPRGRPALWPVWDGQPNLVGEVDWFSSLMSPTKSLNQLGLLLTNPVASCGVHCTTPTQFCAVTKHNAT
jgi:hypothetical protein